MTAQVIPLPDTPSLICADCGGTLTLRHKPEHWHGASAFVYLCTTYQCNGLCSAHPDGTPQGIPADAETRRARSMTHKAFDPLWRKAINLGCYSSAGQGRGESIKRAHRAIGRKARERAYAWLADQLGLTIDETHIGLFDIETCRRVWKLCQGTDAGKIRRWAKNQPVTTPEINHS